jgi:hypothetical protein
MPACCNQRTLSASKLVCPALDTNKLTKAYIKAFLVTCFLEKQRPDSDIISMTLLNAGDKFDRFGVQKDPDAKFNALEYFATQLDTIQNNSIRGVKAKA